MLTESDREAIRRLAEETAVTITVSGPDGSETLSLNYFDAGLVMYDGHGVGINRRVREAIDRVRAVS